MAVAGTCTNADALRGASRLHRGVNTCAGCSLVFQVVLLWSTTVLKATARAESDVPRQRVVSNCADEVADEKRVAEGIVAPPLCFFFAYGLM